MAPVLTERATRFVGRATFDALASEPTQTSVWDEASPIPHTRLGQRADLVVVAPATADLLARYAAGLADDLLTTTLLATRAPVRGLPGHAHRDVGAPRGPGQPGHARRPRGRPWCRPRTAGWPAATSGRGGWPSRRPSSPPCSAVLAGPRRRRPTWPARGCWCRAGRHPRGDRPGALHHQPLLGQAGPRPGRRGRGRRGADVVAGDHQRPAAGPAGAEVVEVETAAEMEEAVLARAADADVVVMAAAVADFRPKVVADTKLHKADGVPELVLEPTTDILAELGRRRRPGPGAGRASPPRPTTCPSGPGPSSAAKGVDLMVANDVSAPRVGFDHDTNAVTIFGADGTVTTVPLSAKAAVADAVFDRVVAARWRTGRTATSVGADG